MYLRCIYQVVLFFLVALETTEAKMSHEDVEPSVSDMEIVSALELLKKQVPELCTFVHIAKEMCETGKQPDTRENTIECMKLVVDILMSRKKEDIRPSVSHLHGWPQVLSLKEEEIELSAMRIDKKTATLMTSIRALEEACKRMEVATRLAQHQYNNSLVFLDELVASAGRGEYKAPNDLNELIAEIKAETEAQVTLSMMRNTVVTPSVSPRRQARVVVARTETNNDSDSVNSLLDSDQSSFGGDDDIQPPLELAAEELADGIRAFSQFFENNNTGLIRSSIIDPNTSSSSMSSRPSRPPPPGFSIFGT